ADHIIDLGPHGGAGGGEVVASGTPEDVARASDSYTGQYLAPLLGVSASPKRRARAAAAKPRRRATAVRERAV
nr:hypothetical protein [Actinomycetota bacterium]